MLSTRISIEIFIYFLFLLLLSIHLQFHFEQFRQAFRFLIAMLLTLPTPELQEVMLYVFQMFSLPEHSNFWLKTLFEYLSNNVCLDIDEDVSTREPLVLMMCKYLK